MSRPEKQVTLRCAVEGCDNHVKMRGWCKLHYQRWYRNGDPLKVRRRWKGAAPIIQGDTAIVHLTRGLVTIVDVSDLETISDHVWGCTKAGYAFRYAGRSLLYLHRAILGAGAGQSVDHINGDKLDNRRLNLRLGTQAQNTMNRGVPKSNTSGYKGVSWARQLRKWRCYCDGKHIGYFATAEAAARAYDQAATLSHGEYAKTNAMLGLLPNL